VDEFYRDLYHCFLFWGDRIEYVSGRWVWHWIKPVGIFGQYKFETHSSEQAFFDKYGIKK
jgi:hypothetical protein